MIQTDKTILFLTSSHSVEDDRILYHQALELSKENRVFIFSTYGGKTGNYENITLTYDATKFRSLRDKIKAFYLVCKNVNPDLIICSEPLPIFGAFKFKKEKIKKVVIIYDVTEFYPSKKNLIGLTSMRRYVKSVLLTLFNWFACKKVDRFIFGEVSKSLFYRKYFKKSAHIFLPYYQNLKFYNNQSNLPPFFTIGYTGKFSEEKGIYKFSEVLRKFSSLSPSINWKVRMIGWFDNELTENKFREETEGLQVEIIEPKGFIDYCHSLSEFTVFFDIRETDKENNLCIPIKLYTYASAGRPIIYSSIEAIKNEHPSETFFSLFQFDDTDGMVNKLYEYYTNFNLIEVDSLKARKFSESNNWLLIKDDFLNFVLDR